MFKVINEKNLYFIKMPLTPTRSLFRCNSGPAMYDILNLIQGIAVYNYRHNKFFAYQVLFYSF